MPALAVIGAWLAAAPTVEPAPWWATLVAALLGGLIGSAIAAGVAIWTGRAERAHNKALREEDRKAEQAAQQRRERREAYTQLLTAAMMVVHTVGMLRLAVEVRSGLKEGIDVAFHIRKPIEPFEIDDRLHRDFGPLFEAWSHIWVIGSQEAIKKANRLLDSAVTVLGAGTTRGEANVGLDRWLLGDKWTPKQMEIFQGKVKDLGVARKDFAEVARLEMGAEVAELFLRPEEAKPEEPVASD